MKRKEKELCSELEHRLDLLKTNTGDHKVFRDTEINTVKEELYAIYSNRGMGDKIRSRVQWWEEGEKSTKYFHNLEKARGKDKAWHKIKDKNGQLVYGTSRIQECQVDFYKNLFTAQGVRDENAENSVLEKLDKTLDNESKQNLEGNIDMPEVVSALKKTKKQ